MSEMIDRLKSGLAEAQKRHAEVTRRWQVMQAEFNISNAEVVGYQKVLEIETKRELQQAADATPASTTEPKPSPKPEPSSALRTDEISKAQVIRDALAEHPNVTPAQLWGAVREKVPNRNYVYSVLARLHAKDEVSVRRGRYSIKQAAQEDSEPKQQTLQ